MNLFEQADAESKETAKIAAINARKLARCLRFEELVYPELEPALLHGLHALAPKAGAGNYGSNYFRPYSAPWKAARYMQMPLNSSIPINAMVITIISALFGVEFYTDGTAIRDDNFLHFYLYTPGYTAHAAVSFAWPDTAIGGAVFDLVSKGAKAAAAVTQPVDRAPETVLAYCKAVEKAFCRHGGDVFKKADSGMWYRP